MALPSLLVHPAAPCTAIRRSERRRTIAPATAPRCPRHTVRSAASAHALDALADAEITVRIVDAEEGQALNRDYRQKDYATNVLTFDYATEPLVMADLVLCAPVVAREAKEQPRRPWPPTTPTCWCTARCTPRAGTTRPARPTPKRWKPAKSRDPRRAGPEKNPYR